MSISQRITSLMLVIFLTVLFSMVSAHLQVGWMQFDSRVVNHAGIVRGATQRLIKLEVLKKPNDKIISKLDKLVDGLIDGNEELNLPKAEDNDFIEQMKAVKSAWNELKQTISAHRIDSKLRDRLLDQSEKYFDKTNSAVFAAEKAGKQKVTSFRFRLLIIGIAVSAITAFVWWTMYGGVALPLKKASELLTNVSNGDLTVKFDEEGSDEIGVLNQAANTMVEYINQLITEANDVCIVLARMSEQLYISTSQISSSNKNVSSQAESVASATEEMSATVQEMARNTTQVYESAENARSVSLDGSNIVSQVIEAVQEIADVVGKAAETARALGSRSEKIGMVVQVIEDIADQTNLLALNAAIEAARAGENGRGFAVVADEVRKLAEKTVKATQEISQMVGAIQSESQRAVSAIEHGMETVSAGKVLGERAGSAINDIQNQVVEATEQTRQIASATEELAATALETAQNVDAISEAVRQTSQSSAGVEKTAQTVVMKAEELYSITGRLKTK